MILRRGFWVLAAFVVGLALHNLVMALLYGAGLRGWGLTVVEAWKDALLAGALAWFAVREGEVAAVRHHPPYAREGLAEALEPGDPDGRDPLRPRVHRLEEVVGPVRAAEAGVGDADVDHARLGARREQLVEEPQLPLATPERHARGDLSQHGRSVPGGDMRLAPARACSPSTAARGRCRSARRRRERLRRPGAA